MTDKKIRVLELFSGTGSITKVCYDRDYECVSVDLHMEADINEDIMTWDYKEKYKPGDFDMITASPVCLYWSNLNYSLLGRPIARHNGEVFTRELWQQDIDEIGKPMVDKVREIIDYFNPKYYIIENPNGSLMKEYITDLPYYVVDYCQYGFKYRKRTRFWTNIEGFEPKTCVVSECPAVLRFTTPDGKYHQSHQKINGNWTRSKMLLDNFPNLKSSDVCTKDKYERYRIPYKLIRNFFDACVWD